MRKYAKSWVASIFLGALALSFAAWGIADVFKGSTDTSVATVGSTVISTDIYQHEYQNALKAQAGPTGVPMTSEEARKRGVPAQILQNLISRAAVDNEVRDLGLTTSDAMIAGQVKALRIFAGPLGTFDRSTFLRIITDRGYTEQGFIDLMRGDLTREQLLSAARAGFSLPPGYVVTLFSFLNEIRAADYVIIPASAAGTVPAPTDAQLLAFEKSHADRFSTPEYREVDYAIVSPDDLASHIQITDTQIRQQYELSKDDPRFASVPEKRDVEQITFTNESDAKAAKAKIDAGVKFDDLAKSLGKTADNLGTVTKDDLGARGAAVFALAQNGVTDPQKNLSGWVILHVTKITPGINRTFDDVKADIRKDVSDRLIAAKLGDISNAYTDANSGGMSVIEAGKKVGMRTGHIAAMDANGLAPDGSKIEVASDPDFIKAVFGAEVGDEGDPIGTKTAKLFVVKVDGQIPPKLKPLDQVRAEVTAQWTRDETSKMLVAKANALAALATKQGNLNAAASVAGTPVLQSGRLHRPVSLDAQENPNLPPLLVAQLFRVMPGSAVAGPAAKDGSFIVARVTGVYHPPIPQQTLQFIQGSAQLSRQSAGDFEPAIANAARNAQGVKINQANADRITGEGS